MKKKLIMLIGIIILVICGGVGYYFYLISVQEDVLKSEVINYSNKDLYKDDYMVDVKTKGDYAYIEESIKNYYRELSNHVKKIRNYLIDEDLQNLMIPDNLEKDRPKFLDSYKLIDDTKKEINESKEKIIELCSREYIKNLVSDRIRDEYYIKLYDSLMNTDKDIEELKDVRVDMEELSNNLNVFLDKVKELLEVLEKNNDSWSVEDNVILISDKSILNEYNNKYKELKDVIDNKLSKYKDRAISKGNSNSVVSA